ncbi:MAG: adenylosuccinate lyase [Elusimicrobiota bacterium]|nr:adenylosuccinate lyase [Endomicrobiia bacterium]MDW8165649.1 adenylosuccinate lyase [Elusimicrobiota bacterium]
MISRYSLPEMSNIWSEENKFKIMLEIELKVIETLTEEKIIPKEDYKEIKNKIKLNIERIKEIEKITKHDVAAFVDQLSESIGTNAAKWIHFGLTSSDVLDTATALQLKQSCDQLLKRLNVLLEVLKKQSIKYKNTIMMGRTHGVHAEPITFGYKIASWYCEIKQHLEVLEYTKEIVSYGKISGVVGTYSQLSPNIEKKVLKKLNLKPEPISTQVIPRYRYSYYLSTLANIAASLEKFATEIRHLQRTEVLEAEEPFSKGQKGSSAMPHKRNPISSENICGLARLIRSYVIAGYENVALWHERDISHSSAERIILPDASIALDFIIFRFTNLIKDIVVYPQNMLKNIEISHNSFYSQTLLTELIKKGINRQEAYKIIQPISQEAFLKNKDFIELCCKDKNLTKFISPKEIKKLCNIKFLLRFLDGKYEEIF